MKKNTITLSVRIFAVILSINILISCNSSLGESEKNVILYTDSDGDSFPVIAEPGQVIVSFVNDSEREQQSIIEICEGEVIMHYPHLRSYLVATEQGDEMTFILNIRNQPGVRAAYLNAIYEPLSIKMHIIDTFKKSQDEEDEHGFIHGEYCYESAVSANPDNPTLIYPVRFDTEGNFKNSTVFKYVDEIFSSNHPDSLILINMSFGNYIYEVGLTEEKGDNPWYVKKDNKYVKVPWAKTFDHEYGNLERTWWKQNYIRNIQELAQQMIPLTETYRNYIIFKASGNDYCHEIDKFIFNHLANKLSPEELDIIQNHFIFVSAKDDDRKVPNEIYASYANSPEQYCPYLTMTDISHLSYDGTSFSSPYMLGLAAKLFNEEGYRPMNSDNGGGYNVADMLEHIRYSTQNYAQTIRQPGLYTQAENKQVYYYNRNYTFTGIVRSGTEDLCETGIPENYLYIQISPIDIKVGDSPEFEEQLSGVTRLQIIDKDLWNKIGYEITLSGDLVFNIAGCHIHTDAYLENVNVKEQDEGEARNSSDAAAVEPKTYYYNELQVLKGTFYKKTVSEKDEFTGKISYNTLYYLKLDSPINIIHKNADKTSTAANFEPLYNKTEIYLYGNFNPKEFSSGSRVMVQGRMTPEITGSSDRGVQMLIENIFIE